MCGWYRAMQSTYAVEQASVQLMADSINRYGLHVLLPTGC